MKSNKTKQKMKPLTLFLTTWWTIVFLLIALQAYFMSKSIAITLITIPFIFLPCALAIYLPKKAKQKTVQKIGIVFGALHFIPLALQFMGIITPGIDNIITGFFSVLFIYNNIVKNKKIIKNKKGD